MNKKTRRYKRMIKRFGYLRRIVILIFTFVYASSFSTRNSSFFIKPVFTPDFMVRETPWADSVLNTLSLEEKIAQLIMVQVYSSSTESEINDIRKTIEKNKIGGIIFSKGGPGRQASLTNKFQQNSDVPLLIAMDAEWGLAMRLDSTIAYPYQMTLGAVNDNELIYKMGKQVAEQCKRLGVHMNFAPVVDINNNPLNPVIGYRSFGENRENVMAKGLMYMLGMQDNGILTTLKHFPGHGDTKKDSHLTLPVINHSRDYLDSIEIYPFEQLINNGAAGVMTAHLFIPSLDSSTNLPSSLSPKIVTDLLIKQMGFGGLIVSDALQMRGASDYYAPYGELEVLAFKAGNDILLMPTDVSKAIHYLKKEVRKGRVSEEDIDKRCHKILKAKEWAGLNNYKPIKTKNLYKELNKPEYYVLKDQMIEHSLTLLKNSDNIIPLKRIDTLKIATISLNTSTKTKFQNTIDLYLESDHFILNENNLSESNQILDTLENYNTVIISIHNTTNSVSKNFGILPYEVDFLQKASSIHSNVILTLLANAYGLGKIGSLKNFKAVSISYEPDDLNESYMAQALFGGLSFRGKIPVKAHPEIDLHTGYNTLSNRLSYKTPENVRMNSDTLLKIEDIVYEAINQKATPGCQILIARKGVVIYNKAFGYHTYRKKYKVQLDDLYDIASLTKVFATTDAIMRLYEDHKINIDTTISTYLSFLDTTNKKDIIIKEIMAHQARLPGWIPFYMSTLEGLYPERDLFSNKISSFYALQFYKSTYITRFLKYVDGIYSKEPDDLHNTKVADGLYILDSYRDSIFNRIASCELLESNEYKYSDLGFYLLYDVIEKITGISLKNYMEETLYKPIGANNTTFLPLNKFERDKIIPTEDDLIFRKQLLQGYVHDPGAAMLGGVSGHAGLFSTANDLSKIMQMYLNKGLYGYKNYHKSEIIEKFTSSPFLDNENRRGIGFDKPPLEEDGPSSASHLCSRSSFGHSGFTGTIAWADPETDLVYIFLSNRIYPDQNNNILSEKDIRTRIQDLIYNSIY